MSDKAKKILLIALGLILVVGAIIGVLYLVRKPTVKKATPTPAPKTTQVNPSPVTAQVFEVAPGVACTNTFTVACLTSSPSATPSGVPSPSPSTPPSAQLDCVSKEVFADDSRNRAGFYYLESRIADASTLETGTTVVYNIKAKNNGGVSVPDTKITDVLSANLTFIDADSDCTYDSASRTVTCSIGTLAAGAQAQRTIRAKINVSSNSSIANTADVYSSNGQRDSCSVQLSANGKVVAPSAAAPSSLPEAGVFEVTVGTIGVGVVLLIAGALGLLLL